MHEISNILNQKKAEMEHELNIRKAQIKESNKTHKVPPKSYKKTVFDPTENQGLGLLSEITLVEMK